MLIEAGRLPFDCAQLLPLSIETFVTGLSGAQPLVFWATGESPSSLNAQLKSDAALGAETTTQYEDEAVSCKLPKLKLVSVGTVVETVAVCVPNAVPEGTPAASAKI